MIDQAKALQPEFTRIRRQLHQNPELGFDVFETAALVAETLQSLGIETQTGVGRTGVVARLGNGNGPSIGIRADMDALPIQELNDVPYKSQVPGKMHACGHDGHTTMLLGVAMLLKDAEIDGEIRLLFQPSEEVQDPDGSSGATEMIKDDAVEGLDAVIALHVDGQIETGKISIEDGPALANADRLVAKIIGKGGHGARPEIARDPIFLLAPVLTALHGVVSRWIDPNQAAVLTIGQVHGGSAFNVIPNEVMLDMTMRSFDDRVRQQLIDEIESALSVAKALGGDYEMEYLPGYPATINDPDVANWLRQTAGAFLGPDNVISNGPVMWGEDFGYMSRASKGAMMFLGVKKPGGVDRFLHHPEFDLDEDALPIGAAILAETALRFVKGSYR